MSDTILSGNFTVYYLDDNRQKRIEWTGGTGTNTLNELYSAIQDHFDESIQMDDGIPMSAQTPVEYTIGSIDSGDNDPWYITYETMEHLTGGALRTASWTRVVGSNTGIVVVPVTSAGRTIVAADIGYTITTDTDGDSGTLLDIIDVGDTNDYFVIRPDTSAAGNSFDNSPTSGDGLTSSRGAFTATQAVASTTGEQIWANLYSIGTIEFDTHIYIYQGTIGDNSRTRLYSIVDQTQDWWSDGHIDICVPIRDYKSDTNPIIDTGYLTVLARKFTTLYDNFEVATSVTAGGRNPIPLATGPDLDNQTGYASITTTAVATDDFTVGDEIYSEATGGTEQVRAIITQIDGTSPTYTFHYYLIDDPLNDFPSLAETIFNADATGEATKNGSAPADQGPALNTWFTNNAFPSATYAFTTVDINDDGTAEGYGITLDCNSNPLTEVYEWIKYTFRRGNTATTNSDGIEAEQYIGAEVFLEYSGSVTGTIDEGDDVLQATSGATGVVISHDTTLKQILLRNVRGTFDTSNVVSSQDTGSGSVTPNTTAAAFAPKKAAPLGTFAGGTFFGARGVVLSNWVAGDENSFQLTDSQGTLRQRPVAISIEVTNLVGTDETTATDDRVAVFRLTGSGGDIDKTEYSAAGGETAGDPTLVVDTAIATDVPGKTTGGVLRLRDASDNNTEYRIRYSSWATSTFTLANFAAFVTTATTNTTQVTYATGGFNAAVKRGDLVYNSTRTAVSYVASVDSDTQLTIAPAIANQTTGDTVEINCIPIALVDTADDVYVSLLDQYPTASTASVSIVYVSPIFFRVRVRNVAASDPDGPIIPFSTDDSTSGTDRSIATIRTIDTIYT